MSVYEQSIVTEIKRKNVDGFGPSIPFGTDQRFIGALLNSGNNNLEEQSLMGVDCTAVIWTDSNDIHYMTKKFYNESAVTISTNGYYILFVTDYSSSIKDKEFKVEDQALYVRPDTVSSFVLAKDNLDLNVYNTQGQIKVDSDFVTVRQEILCLRTDLSDISDTQSNTDIVISTKVIDKKITSDGKIHYRQRITNSLT